MQSKHFFRISLSVLLLLSSSSFFFNSFSATSFRRVLSIAMNETEEGKKKQIGHFLMGWNNLECFASCIYFISNGFFLCNSAEMNTTQWISHKFHRFGLPLALPLSLSISVHLCIYGFGDGAQQPMTEKRAKRTDNEPRCETAWERERPRVWTRWKRW